jgi:hypothetical protein
VPSSRGNTAELGHANNRAFLTAFNNPPVRVPAPAAVSLAALTAYDNAINIYDTDLVATFLDAGYEGGFNQYSFSGTLADGTVISGVQFSSQNRTGARYQFLPPRP